MLLKLKNIGKIYNSNDILTIGIRKISLELDYNEFVTIEGESGSGKSTLLNVIAANDTYEEGELYFNGSETSHYSEADWEKYREENIAMVFQDFNIIENLTVRENVELALLRIEDKQERRSIAQELIAKVGLEQQINQKASKLSGGEKQRTVIARALAKDSPVILADEPTGNLDVKSSKEIARLLKEASKDRLVIVVTHNPEFFIEYATRRITIYDGALKEDKVISRPAAKDIPVKTPAAASRKKRLKDIFKIGVLNYKSRPKFTAMMSFALFIFAITFFALLSIFNESLIQNMTNTIETVGVSGKVILSSEKDSFTLEDLDELAGTANAGFYLMDKDLSQFKVSIPRSSGMLKAYEVNCLYAPYDYNLEPGNAVLVLPSSCLKDKDKIVETFINAEAGLRHIEVKTTMTGKSVNLYLSHYDLINHGVKIKAINSSMKLGEIELTVYTYRKNLALDEGQIQMINSTSYKATEYSAVLSIKSNRLYEVMDDSLTDEKNSSRLIVELSEADYDLIFSSEIKESEQVVLYFSGNRAAAAAIKNLPEGIMGMLSESSVYAFNAGDVYTSNTIYYFLLIGICILFAILVSIIFGRSVKVFQTDFQVYRTLGISSKISSKSLYIQMLMIFLPTLVLLPLVSLAAAFIPGSSITFISFGNYFFIEAMLLLIVELVAVSFHRSISGKSIRKGLSKGIKG